MCPPFLHGKLFYFTDISEPVLKKLAAFGLLCGQNAEFIFSAPPVELSKYLDHSLHDSNPKFSFIYKFIPAEQAKRNISKSGEYILTDRNRSDGEYRAPYTDQVFDGASMPQPGLPFESRTGTGTTKSGAKGSGNCSTANTELYSPDHSASSPSVNNSGQSLP
jgi:hypothetical protein